MYKLYGHVYRWAFNRAVVNLGFGNKCGVDVSSVPIEELVAVVSGDAPGLLRGRDTQLAVEGQVVWHVHFRGIPEKQS